MLKTIKNIVRLVLKNFSFLLILFVLFANNVLRAEDAEKKFIGFVDSLEGSVNKEDVDDLIKLNAFDQIFTHNKIKIGSNSSIVVSFIDNSILTLESDSEFLVEKFDKLSEEPSFIIAITKGKFAFESGTIAKNDKGIMRIKLGEMEIDLKGTAITGGISDVGDEITIALVEDTMKNTGEIKVSTGDETITITDAHAGLKLSEDKPMEKTTMNEEEIIKAADAMSKAVVQASTIDPKEIERAIMRQLTEGKSGLTNLEDVQALLGEISSFQDDKRESIVAESTRDLSTLSEIIVNSESEQSLSLMQRVMDNDTGNATLLMNEIMGGKDEKADFDIFSHIAGADAGNFEALRETIVAGMIKDQSTFATDTMAQMMKVSDDATGSYLVYEITHMEPTETADDAGASLAMNVLASFTAIASEKMTEIYQQDPTMIDMLTTFAFESATEEDLGMMSTMMQNSTGGNTAMLMQSMVAYNPEMVATVYDDLTSQDFDIFNHIETGRKAATILANEYQADPTMLMDPTFEDPAYEYPAYEDPAYGEPYDPAYGDPTMQFFDDLKSEIFTEIVNNYEGTAAEITSELMMNTSGDNAMFMMEDVMYDNPELVGQVMSSFAEEEFDIFEHFETAPLTNENQAMVIQSPYQEEFDPERVKLTKEERELAKAEKKAARILAKTEKKAEKKAARILAKTEKKAAKLLAKQTGFMAEEDPLMTEDPFMTEDPYMTNEIYGMQNFKAQIFTEMITYADEYTMDTMAQIVSTSDAETSALVFESIIQQPSMTDPTASMYGPENSGMALEFLDSLNQMDSEAIGNMYEENSNLMGDVFESALSSATSTDAGAISGIISSSNNDAMSSMMFQNVSDNADQSFMGDVFVYVAADAPELLMAMAETNEDLYENFAQDVDPTMTVASLMTDIYTTEYDTYTAAAATDTTDAVSTNTKRPTMMKPATSNPYQINDWMSGIYVYASSQPYTNGVTVYATGLPPGLYFNSSGNGGEISGTPTTKGNYQVSVTATDMMDPSKFRTRNFAIRIKDNVAGASGSGPTWDYYPNAPSTLTTGSAIMDIYLNVTGSGTITYTPQNLPMGLYLTSYGSSYVISGTPSMVNTNRAYVTITATDMNGSTSTSIDFPPVTNSGGGGTGPTWSGITVPGTLTDGVPITAFSLSATGTGTISYDVDSMYNLPSGLYLAAGTGEITGTPDTTNMYTQTVMFTATDDNGTTTESVEFPTVDAGSSGPTWSGITVPGTLTDGVPITAFSLSATGTGTISYDVDSMYNLPSGLYLAAGTGEITGTPDATNMYTQTVMFTATDDNGTTTESVEFPTVDAGSSGPTWSGITVPGTLTDGVPITAFSLSATGTGTISYDVDSMYNLPSGLYLAAGTGEITGTPDATNMYTQTVMFTATDDNGTTTESVEFPTVDAGSSNVAWGASLSGMPTTLTASSPFSSFNLLDSISDAPTNRTFSVVGTKPTWLQLTLDSSTGNVAGTPTIAKLTETAVTFKVVEDGNISNSANITVNFPIISAAAETFAFNTDADLGTKPGGVSFAAIPITATASQGTAFTYLFVSNDPTNFAISANEVSGIPPRLKIAASYQIVGKIKVGAVTKGTRTFTILIAAYIPCMSPVANICS